MFWSELNSFMLLKPPFSCIAFKSLSKAAKLPKQGGQLQHTT
ncbi:hypothetical protein SLEP1_g18095 [Rubroshorea leprosula]|uniref:Uncharacterized protein n=1 Tax=Rubroshorea leprosula TaxID=152421 RepID=A0AAV5J5B5_9ROSI|nr:hypothetical protein SLEP1_g18095 [Rubroshorea leprosula]